MYPDDFVGLPWDDVYLCAGCGGVHVLNRGGLCLHCKRQRAYDNEVPPAWCDCTAHSMFDGDHHHKQCKRHTAERVFVPWPNGGEPELLESEE